MLEGLKKKKKDKASKVIYEVYIPCPECTKDAKGNLKDCPHCGNTREQLKEWIKEREAK